MSNLPPLPEPDHSLDCGTMPFFREDQMRAYAEEAVKMERERCETMAAFSLEAQREGYMRLWRAYERVDRGGAMYFLPTGSREW
jgi:hypothetical protein